MISILISVLLFLTFNAVCADTDVSARYHRLYSDMKRLVAEYPSDKYTPGLTTLYSMLGMYAMGTENGIDALRKLDDRAIALGMDAFSFHPGRPDYESIAEQM